MFESDLHQETQAESAVQPSRVIQLPVFGRDPKSPSP